MDLLDHLTKEHREAEAMIAKLEETEPGTVRNQLIEELTTALHTHMQVEEQFLYPIVVEVIGEEENQEAHNEHNLARDGLVKMHELRGEPGFAAALDMVKAGISHHVEDEEEKMFPELRTKAGERVARLDPEKLEAVIDLTRDELYAKAQAADVPGRSEMSRDELARALADMS